MANADSTSTSTRSLPCGRGRGRGRDLTPRMTPRNPNRFSKALRSLAVYKTLHAASVSGTVLGQVSDMIWPRQTGGFAELFEVFGWICLNPDPDLTKLQDLLETLAAFPADLMQEFVLAYSTEICEPPAQASFEPAEPATPRRVVKTGPGVENYDPTKHRMGGFHRVISL